MITSLFSLDWFICKHYVAIQPEHCMSSWGGWNNRGLVETFARAVVVEVGELSTKEVWFTQTYQQLQRRH